MKDASCYDTALSTNKRLFLCKLREKLFLNADAYMVSLQVSRLSQNAQQERIAFRVS